MHQAPRLIGCGVAAIDSLLGGGLPLGGITELTGLASSGRTSLAISLLRGATWDSACAYIDVSDNFDPRSAIAAGVNQKNLLWVRIAQPHLDVRRAPAFRAPATTISREEAQRAVGGHCGSRHPRTETKGLHTALGQMLSHKATVRLKKMEGTPGYPNRRLGLAAVPKEQVDYEHFNTRRPDASDPIRQANDRAAIEARERIAAPRPTKPSLQRAENPWNRLDRAMRVTDQVLQSGGFRVVVLDLGSTPPEQALRIPSATWFRFRRVAQEGDAILLLLTQAPCAQSSALCVLDCAAHAATFSGNLLSGLSSTVETARQRLSGPFTKKAPGRAASWQAGSTWMRAAGK